MVSFTACFFIDTPCLYRHCSLVSFSSWSIFEIIDSESVSCKVLSGLPQRWFLSVSFFFFHCDCTIIFSFFVCLVTFLLKTGHSDIWCGNSRNRVLPCQRFAALAVEDCLVVSLFSDFFPDFFFLQWLYSLLFGHWGLFSVVLVYRPRPNRGFLDAEI